MNQTPASLSAIELASGLNRWTVTLPDDSSVQDIAVQSDSVIVRIVAEDVHRLVCFDGSDGHVKWEMDLPGAAASRLRCTSETVAVASMPLNLATRELSDGSVRWDLSGVVGASTHEESWCEAGHPVFDECVELAEAPETYLLGTRRQIMAFSAQTGALLWSRPLGTVETMQVRGDAVYVVDMENHLHRLHIETGASAWSFECDVEEDVNPFIVDDVALVRTDEGDLYALEASDGAVRWRLHVPGISSFGEGASGRTYVATYFGDLHCIDIRTGEQLWHREFGKVIPGPRVFRAAAERCLVSVMGDLQLLDASTGSQIRALTPGSTAGLVCSPPDEDFEIHVQPGIASRLELEDLSISWSAPIPDGEIPAYGRCPVAFGDGSVFIVGQGSRGDRPEAADRRVGRR